MLPKAKGNWTMAEARHLLNRAGFGGSPDEIVKFYRLGREKAVDFLLNPKEPIEEFPKPEWADLENAMEEVRENSMQRREMMSSMKGKSSEEHEGCGNHQA